MRAHSHNPAALIERVERRLTGSRRRAYFVEMKKRYRRLLDEALSACPGGLVLEVGCSPGTLTVLLTEAGMTVAGIDLNPFESFHAGGGGDSLASMNLEGAAVFQLDVTRDPFPFRDGAFDLVFFNETLEHLDSRPDVPLREMARVLKPGGRLFVTTPNVASLRNRLRFLFGSNIHPSVREMCELAPYKRHRREYTLADVVELIERVGLRAVKAERRNFGGPPGGSAVKRVARVFYDALCLAAPALGTHILVVAER